MRPDRLGTIQHGGPRTLRSSTAKRLLIGFGVAFFILAVPIAITGSEDDRRTVLAVGAVAFEQMGRRKRHGLGPDAATAVGRLP